MSSPPTRRLSPAAALTEGFGDALLAAGALAMVGALLAAVLIRKSAPARTAASGMPGQPGYWRAETIALADGAERDID